VRLLVDPYFQVSALEAILSWLQDEMSRVEDALVESSAVTSLVEAVVIAKGASFENLLEPLLKILRHSSALSAAIVQSSEVLRAKLFHRILEKVKGHSKAVVRLNLLKLLRLLLETELDQCTAPFVDRYGIRNTIVRVIRKDGAVLVREIAREIIQLLPNSGELSESASETSNRPQYSRSSKDTSSIPRRTRSGSQPQPRAATQPTVPPLPTPLSPILTRSPSTPARVLIPKRKPRGAMSGLRRTSSETSAPLSPSSSTCSSPEPVLPPLGSVGLALRTTGLNRSDTGTGLPVQLKSGSRQKLRDISWNRP